ncbi:protein lethal(2)denticleless-like [Tropilaelaps mercedesae]|uniref:Protein lethal(2)denticleless-like n=1 Tax=Tropilaelaps mercedesae TaxID=418985 RepID=A0A1V9WXY1_9ACAR|nr:protein lethal(2)denticleless-like [Tropilaelaps mercedesae]
MDELKNLRRRKFRQKIKFAGLSYVMYQRAHGINFGKICAPLDRLKATDRIRIPSDVHQDSDAHPIVCRFRAPHDPMLAIANEDGLIEIIDTTYNKLKSRKALMPHRSMVSDIAWLSKGHLLNACCPPQNQLAVLDIDCGEEIWAKRKLHKGSVKVIALKPDDTDVFASGGRDGDIVIYDRRTDDPVLRVGGAHPKKVAGSRRSGPSKSGQGAYGITSLNFRDSNHIISTASGGGYLFVWDLRRSYNLLREARPFLRLSIDGGGSSSHLPTASTGTSTNSGLSISNENTAFTYAAMCPYRQTLYAQCSDNVIYAFDINVYADKPVSIFYGHNAGRGEGAYFIRMDVSPSGKFLAIGSPRMDEFCEEQPIPIFDTTRPGLPLCVLKGHYAEPTCPAWCSDLKLASCGDDQQLILWEPVGVDDDMKTWGYCEMSRPDCNKNISEKWIRLHEAYNMPAKGDSTPRVNRAARCCTRSLSEWLKNSPGSPRPSHAPGPRLPLTPLKSVRGQINSPFAPKRHTPQERHTPEDAARQTTPNNRSLAQSPATHLSPHTPKRRKLNTPRSKPITGFFARQSIAESSPSATAGALNASTTEEISH